MSSKTVVVAGICSSASEKVRIFIHGLYYRTQEYEKLCISWGVRPGSRRFWPSSVLRDQLLCFPEPLRPAKGFSWSRQTRPCLCATFLRVSLSTGCGRWQCWPCWKLEQARAVRVRLIVFCFCWNAKFPKLPVQFFHKSRYSFLESAIIMIVHFLSFWRHCSKKCTTGVDEVFALIVKFFVNQKYSCSAPTVVITFSRSCFQEVWVCEGLALTVPP